MCACVRVPSSVSVTLVQACTRAVSIALCMLPACVLLCVSVRARGSDDKHSSGRV